MFKLECEILQYVLAQAGSTGSRCISISVHDIGVKVIQLIIYSIFQESINMKHFYLANADKQARAEVCQAQFQLS